MQHWQAANIYRQSVSSGSHAQVDLAAVSVVMVSDPFEPIAVYSLDA